MDVPVMMSNFSPSSYSARTAPISYAPFAPPPQSVSARFSSIPLPPL